MCGIAGYYRSSNSPEIDLQSMVTAISHRGPDDHGYFEEGPVGLGHARLSIIDLSDAAKQPMISQSQQSVISYNGEIYNFKSLSGTTNLEHNSDTYHLLEHLESLSMDGLNEVNGMFSFAYYEREAKVLTLVRDRLGIKPLFYYWDGKTLVFGSEIKGILRALDHKPEIDKQALQDYLFHKYIPAPSTIYENIFKLEPGHLLKFDGKRLQKECYYDLKQHATNYSRPEEPVSAVNNLLRDSITLRLTSDVEVGAFLSGGTDSSLISSYLESSSKTFTIRFTETSHDESTYATRVANELGLNPNLKEFQDEVLLEVISDHVEQFDEPFADDSTLPTLLLSRFTGNQLKVALSGDGGDELFMGYGYYRWHDRINKLRRLIGGSGTRVIGRALSLDGNRAKRAARNFMSYDEDWWLDVLSQEQYMFNRTEVQQLTGMAYSPSTKETWSEIRELDLNDYKKISLFDMLCYLPNDLLYKVDHCSMKYGLEVRTPLLDHHLAEYVMGLSPDQMHFKAETKYIPKKILGNKLSKELVHRKKWGFPAPMASLLQGPLKDKMHDLLSQESLSIHGLIDQKHVDQLIQKFEKGEQFHHGRIWALMVFQMWYQKHYTE